MRVLFRAVLVWDCGGWEVENAEVCSTRKSYMGGPFVNKGIEKKSRFRCEDRRRRSKRCPMSSFQPTHE